MKRKQKDPVLWVVLEGAVPMDEFARPRTVFWAFSRRPKCKGRVVRYEPAKARGRGRK